MDESTLNVQIVTNVCFISWSAPERKNLQQVAHFVMKMKNGCVVPMDFASGKMRFVMELQIVMIILMNQ